MAASSPRPAQLAQVAQLLSMSNIGGLAKGEVGALSTVRRRAVGNGARQGDYC